MLGSTDDNGLLIKQATNTGIDEDGAKLAAATTVETLESSGPADDKFKKVSVVFDRPFAYFIENTRTGSILMAGIVNNL